MFWGELLPDALLISLAAGVVVGIIPGAGRLQKAGARVAVAAISFAVVFGPFIFKLMEAASRPGAVLIPSSSWEILIMWPIMVAFSALAALPSLFGSMLGAELVNELRGARLRAGVLVVTLVAAIALPAYHGLLVRRVIASNQPSLRAMQADIERKLVRIPKGVSWRTRVGTSWKPTVTGAFCQFRQAHVFVYVSRGRFRSTHLAVELPRITRPPEKREAVRILRSHGVVEPMLLRLSRDDRNGVWRAESGKYSLHIGPHRD